LPPHPNSTCGNGRKRTPWHPGGMQDVSRWLSAAIPPDSRPTSLFQEPRQGFRTCRFPLALESCTPAGVPATGLGALFRWYRCAQPPANVPHPSGVKRKWPPWSVSHSSLHAQNPRPRRSGARDDGGLPGRCEEAAPADAAISCGSVFGPPARFPLSRKSGLRRPGVPIIPGGLSAARPPGATFSGRGRSNGSGTVFYAEKHGKRGPRSGVPAAGMELQTGVSGPAQCRRGPRVSDLLTFRGPGRGTGARSHEQ